MGNDRGGWTVRRVMPWRRSQSTAERFRAGRILLAGADPSEYVQTARPGHRAPHAWLADGRSVIDLFGDGFTLLTLGFGGDASPAWSPGAPTHCPMTRMRWSRPSPATPPPAIPPPALLPPVMLPGGRFRLTQTNLYIIHNSHLFIGRDAVAPVVTAYAG